MSEWIDDEHRQPLRNVENNRNNREYIKAVWAALGQGEGAPKISGGYERGKKPVVPAPRGLNRPEQRYTLSATELNLRRDARAENEYDDTCCLRQDLNVYEIRAKSGNKYNCVTEVENGWHVGEEIFMCHCPDEVRLRLSGYPNTVVCKHVILARLFLVRVGIVNMGWTTEAFAARTGFSEVTIRVLCVKGLIPATKCFDLWEISPVLFDASVAEQIARIVNYGTEAIFLG